MSSNVKDPLFWGIISFITASFGLYSPVSNAHTLSLAAITDYLEGRMFRVGKRPPQILAYDIQGDRIFVPNSGRNTTVIFVDACPCDAQVVRHWSQEAVAKGEEVVVVMPATLGKVASLQYSMPFSAKRTAMRIEEFNRISGGRSLPFVVHIDSSGLVMKVGVN